METIQTKIANLAGHLEEYLKTREELAKLVAAEKSSVMIRTKVSDLVSV